MINDNDLISRAATKEAIRKKFPNISDRCEINEVLNSMPAVDAVPVIKCKDCIYFIAHNAEEGDHSGHCDNVYIPMYRTTVDGWWFCADGKYCGAKMEIEND